MKAVMLVAIGGALGSVLRYLVSIVSKRFFLTEFPLGTWIANTIGCVLIGILAAWLAAETAQNQSLRLVLITGFCGGFTTFSTFSLETIQLIRSGQIWLAALYILASLIACLSGVAIGYQYIKPS